VLLEVRDFASMAFGFYVHLPAEINRGAQWLCPAHRIIVPAATNTSAQTMLR
jgi:hypothetical protein